MKKFFLLAFLAWSGMTCATTPGLPFGIKIDTAYVSNDSYIELEYRVVAPFGKINLFVSTSIEDQNRVAPLTLSGGVGSCKKRVPISLPPEQIVEISILLKGEELLINKDDTTEFNYFFIF